jgi:hypothetical protein
VLASSQGKRTRLVAATIFGMALWGLGGSVAAGNPHGALHEILAQSSDTQAIGLALSGATKIELPLGTDRHAAKRAYAVQAASALSTGAVLTVTTVADLVREDSKSSISRSSVTGSISAVGSSGTLFSLSVTVDPAGTKAGVYSGSLLVSGEGVTATSIPIEVTLKDGPSVKAYALLAVGLILGYVLKWYSDTGKKLGAAAKRVRLLRRRLSGIDDSLVPLSYQQLLDSARDSFFHWDSQAAEDTLKSAEGSLDDAVAAARVASRIRDQLAGQGKALAKSPPELRVRFEHIVELERDALDEALGAPTVGDARSGLDTLFEQVRSINRLALEYPKDLSLEPVVQLFEQGAFAQALAKYREVRPGADSETLLRAAPAAKFFTRGGRQAIAVGKRFAELVARIALPFATAETFFTQVLPFIVGLITVGLIALYGLQTQYLNSDSFGAAATDWLGLFLWGAAASVTGKTLADFVSPGG